MKTKYTRLNVGVTTTFDVSQVGGALDGNHFSESVTSHFKRLLPLCPKFSLLTGNGAVFGECSLSLRQRFSSYTNTFTS